MAVSAFVGSSPTPEFCTERSASASLLWNCSAKNQAINSRRRNRENEDAPAFQFFFYIKCFHFVSHKKIGQRSFISTWTLRSIFTLNMLHSQVVYHRNALFTIASR